MATKTQNKDVLLVAALAKGATVELAAVHAGVSERTVYRRLKNPEFQKRIDVFQEEMLQQSAAVLTAAVQDANHSLVVFQEPSTAPAVRRAAARDILEMALRFREAADLEKRLLDLENHSVAAPASSFQQGAGQPAPTPKRRRGDTPLLMALATGATVAQAAQKAGLSERTVYRRLEDPTFKKRIEAVRADMVKRAAGTLIAATRLAAKTLLDLQDPKTPPAIRRRAARDILELSQKLRQSTILEKRLVELELSANRGADSKAA